ncbi:MAG: MFS transporter [Chloroflexota bacterium]|nr:MFS transporter [Chloroflexota bacterium]
MTSPEAFPGPDKSAHQGRLIGLSILMRLTVDTAMRMMYPFLPVISRGLGISLAQGGLLLAIRSAMIVASPIFGTWNDRHGPRPLLVGALFLQGLSLLWLSTAQGFWAAVPSMVLLGLAAAVLVPTLHTVISNQVPFQRRGRALGIVEFSWALTGLFILPLVGLLMVRYGWQMPIRLTGILSLAASPLPFLLPGGREQAARIQRGFLDLTLSVLGVPSARAALAVSGLMFVAAESFFVTYGAWMENSFGLAPNEIGRIAALLGVAELSASGFSSLFIDRIGKKRGVGIGLMAMTGALILLPLFEGTQKLAVAGMFLFTMSFEFTIVSNIGLLSEQVPRARGTVLSMGAMISAITRAASAFVGAALFQSWGIVGPALFGAGGTLLAVFVLYRWVQEQAIVPAALGKGTESLGP